MTESDENCPEGEICVDLSYVHPQVGGGDDTTISDARVADAVRRAKMAVEESSGEYAAESVAEAAPAAATTAEQIIRIRVHSW